MARAKLREIADAALFDPKQAIWDAVGDLSGFELQGSLVLVGTYIAPPTIMKGPSGEDILFHRTDRSQEEDRFQGKVGLVLKMGPSAFKSDDVRVFEGPVPQINDWVIYRAADGMESFIRGTPVRYFHDELIKSTCPDPALVY